MKKKIKTKEEQDLEEFMDIVTSTENSAQKEYEEEEAEFAEWIESELEEIADPDFLDELDGLNDLKEFIDKIDNNIGPTEQEDYEGDGEGYPAPAIPSIKEFQ